MFKSIGVPELLLIVVIIFVFFGVGKLPQVGSQLGKAIRAFKKGQTEDDDETDKTSPEVIKSVTKKTTRPAKKAI